MELVAKMVIDPDERINRLAEIDLFVSFSRNELAGFAETLDEIECKAGEIICREGELAEEMFILLTGELQIIKDKRKITTVKPVNYVGEMALIEEKPRSATVKAIEPCRLLKISADQFYNYFAQQPNLLISMMKILSQRIRRDTEMIAREFEKANILIHDMKNCLSIFLFLDLFKPDPESKEARYVKFMKDTAGNLNQMMTEALANAKRFSVQQNLRTNNLAALIHDVIESNCLIHPDLKDKKIKFTQPDQLPDFLFAKTEIKRVLTNLIFNAAQASDKGAVIEIILKREDNQAKVEVLDWGSGVPVGLGEKIFMSHFTTKINGNGLGLASCRQIIEERHCGTLEFRDNPEGGAIFSFTLPLVYQKDRQD
jgi:signal transduction histidine kinase